MSELNGVELWVHQVEGIALQVVLGATATFALLLVVGFLSVVAAMLVQELRGGRAQR